MEEKTGQGSGEDRPVERGSNIQGSGRGSNYGRIKGEFLAKLNEEYKAGSSFQILGRKYDLSPSGIYAQFRKSGLLTRTIQQSNSVFSKDHKKKLKLAARNRWDRIDILSRRTKKLVSYEQVHKRVQLERGNPRHCKKCGTQNQKCTYHWANLTGNYYDPQDYIRLCSSCHRIMDAKVRRDAKTRTGKWPNPIRPNWSC